MCIKEEQKEWTEGRNLGIKLRMLQVLLVIADVFGVVTLEDARDSASVWMIFCACAMIFLGRAGFWAQNGMPALRIKSLSIPQPFPASHTSCLTV